MATYLAAFHGTPVNASRCNAVPGVLAMVSLVMVANQTYAQESKTVIGPSNPALHDGAQALLAGDATEGVRLTLLGLRQATDASQRETARSNLCAGYSMLEQYLVALDYCNEVLQTNARNWRALSNRALIYVKLERFAEADSDLLRGEAISPEARTLKAVRRLYLDATNPVAPFVIIDDRRGSNDDDAADDER
jgi:tetratricopeptide (TPR) repeat protein